MPRNPDPNRVLRFPEQGISVTAFEQTADALAAAILAATYPSCAESRRKAVAACRHADLDYLEAVARLMEGTGMSADNARWQLVEYLGAQVGEQRALGAVAREGVTSGGYDADALGNPTHDHQHED